MKRNLALYTNISAAIILLSVLVSGYNNLLILRVSICSSALFAILGIIFVVKDRQAYMESFDNLLALNIILLLANCGWFWLSTLHNVM